MAVLAVAVAPGDIIKYQSFVYGSFVWEIHVRYNNVKYVVNEHFDTLPNTVQILLNTGTQIDNTVFIFKQDNSINMPVHCKYSK